MSDREIAQYRESNPGSPSHLDIEVHPAGAGDLHAVIAINRAAGRPGGTPETVAASIANPSRLTVIATRGPEAIGWAKTHYWDNADGPAPAGHYLGGVTVHPDWRRGGVGTALTEARMAWIWSQVPEAWYVVNSCNRASIDLHRRWGFEEIARAPGFHTTTFTGGSGLLMRAERTER